MDQQPFDDVVVAPQVGSSHAPGFVHMSETAFDMFSALAQQLLSTRSPDSPPVLVNRRLLSLFTYPVAAPPIRL